MGALEESEYGCILFQAVDVQVDVIAGTPAALYQLTASRGPYWFGKAIIITTSVG